MQISGGDAKQLLSKWADNKSPVRAVYVARSGYVAFAISGTLWGLPPDSLVVKSAYLPNEDCMSFRFKDCTFEYGDTREAPAHLQEYATGKYESVVTIF